jgi:hypothetical protein
MRKQGSKKPPPKPKKIKVQDRVVIDGAEHLGAFFVYAVKDGYAEIRSSHNPIPLEELRHSHWAEQPAETEAAEPVDDGKQERLEALRARLSVVANDDDITSCSSRFKLETEIHDLEREIAADEWPDLIGEA